MEPVSGNPLLLVNAIQKPLKKGVPETNSGLLPESSRTSLSLVWFAGTTPENAPSFRFFVLSFRFNTCVHRAIL